MPTSRPTHTVPPGVWRDVGALLFLLLANPALYLGTLSARAFSPDSVAYMALGRAFAEGGGKLYLEGWGHADFGLVLPPLYPLLQAVGGMMSDDFMWLAERISWGALLLTAIPLYYLLIPRCGRPIAIAAVFGLQLNAFYFGAGFVPLTEALFTLLLATMVLLFDRLLARPGALTAALLGATCGLLFLSRQIGVVFFAFAALWLLIGIVRGGNEGPRPGHGFWFLSLFAMLILPYSLILHQQTGQGPLTQGFSLERYAVEGEPAPPSMSDGSAENYAALLEMRQRQRRLLPDGSEMIGQLKEAAENGVTIALQGVLENPEAIVSRMSGNLKHLRDGAGSPLFWLFFLSLPLSLIFRRNAPSPLRRYLPAALLLTYLCAISLFTDTIPRYIHVMLPLLTVAAIGELSRGIRRASEQRSPPWLYQGVVVVILLSIALTLPAHYRQVPLQPRLSELDIPLSAFRGTIPRGEPVFTPQPIYGYLAGGTPRTLPTGTLEQVVTYGRRTGTPWLLMVALDEREPHARNYLGNDWYGSLLLAQRHPDMVEFHGTTGDAVLYRIRLENE